MPPLLDQLRQLRQKVRRLIWLTGLSWVTAGLLAGILLLGFGDWLWHFDDRGLRAGLLTTLLATVGWVAWQQLIAPLRRPVSNLEMSGHLEEQFPKLRRRLVTAVEFLERDVSPKVGSPELQQRLIEQTTVDAQSLDFADVLDRRGANRAVMSSAVLFVIGVLLIAGNSAAASTAMHRLLWPLSHQPWPKSVELKLVRGNLSEVTTSPNVPLRNVQGQPLDLFVVNARGPLPHPTLIEFRQRGRMPQTEVLRTTTLRDSADQSREAAAIRLPMNDEAIEFRAIGGDDHDMPWRELQILSPPNLESFRIEVNSPAYAGEDSVKLPERATQIRAIVGSRVMITAHTNRPVRQAISNFASNSPEATSDDKKIEIAPNGRDLDWEFVVSQSGTSIRQLSLTDRDGFQNPSALRLEVIGIIDPPPVVSLEQPATDQLVTANSMVRIAATVHDDRQLRNVGLEYSVVAQAEPSEAVDRLMHGNIWQIENVPIDSVKREFVLRLAWPLINSEPKVGDRIALRIAASDFCDVGEPRVGRSAMRTLTVVSPDDKLAEIAHRLDLLLHDLQSLASKQSQTKNQTELLRIQAEKADDIRPQDRDALKRVELDQRDIGAQLIAKGDSVTSRAQQLLEQLEDNQLNNSVTRERLMHIASAIEVLSRQTLPMLESTLGRIVRDGLSNPPTSLNLPESLQEVTRGQGEILAALTGLIHDLTQWRNRRELSREIAELATTQETLNRDTTELVPETLGKSISQLPSQQQADVAKIADRQARQAERIEQLRQRLAETPDDTPDRDSPDNLLHEEVLQEFDRQALAAKAREAAREAAENNLGQATRAQQKLAADLKTLAEKLDHKVAANSGNSVRELQELEKELDSVTQQQRRLLDDTREAASRADSLKREELIEQAKTLLDRQAELTKSTETLSSRMKGSPADESREALRRAGRHMQRAGSQLTEQQFARAADEEQTALDDLEQSRRELATARRNAQREQLAEKTDELASAIHGLITRQRTVMDETGRLSADQQKAGKWTRPLSKAALNLGDAEQELADSTAELAKTMEDVEAIQLTLDRATGNLTAAASRIRERQLDEATQRHEHSALDALISLADALGATQPNSSPDNQTTQQLSEVQNPDAVSDEPVPPVAQLKLLRQLQSNVGDRTQFAETRAPKTLSTDAEIAHHEAELHRLAEDQQSVHEATSRLLDRVPVPESTDVTKPPEETKPRDSSLSAMQQSLEHLRASELGKTTQSAQRVAIESLDQLLKLWQQRAAKQQSASRSGQSAPMPDKPPGENSQTSDGSGGKPTGRDSTQARNSSDREQTGTDAEVDLRRQRQLREAVWGHLPPALREKMLNLPHDKTLPKYSEHIRRYYESLAEQE